MVKRFLSPAAISGVSSRTLGHMMNKRSRCSTYIYELVTGTTQSEAGGGLDHCFSLCAAPDCLLLVSVEYFRCILGSSKDIWNVRELSGSLKLIWN